MSAHAVLSKGQERFGDQLWTEEGSADADVDHVGDGLVAEAAPKVVMNTGDDVSHLRQGGMHVTHDVLPVDHHGFAHGASQRGVQDRTIL